MSGPLTSLKKSRRVPFRTVAPAPQTSMTTSSSLASTPRQSTPSLPPVSLAAAVAGLSSSPRSSLLDADDDAALDRLANEVLDDQVLRKLQGQQRATAAGLQHRLHQQNALLPLRRPSSGGARGGRDSRQSAAPTDAELLASATARVAALERECREQREELARRQRRIDALEDKARLWKSAAAAASGSSQELETLRTRCRQLLRQTRQMENFLADYGLIWVGESGGDDSSSRSSSSSSCEGEKDGKGPGTWNWDSAATGGLWKPEDSTAAAPSAAETQPQPDFNRLLESLAELNRIAGDGELKVTPTDTGATLARRSQDSVPLTLYANGLALWSGPFRSYSDPATRQLLADVSEGYFPTELQSRYPDGVAFAVVDRREVVYNRRSAGGGGQRLGGVATRSEDATKLFLNRLPASVVAASGRLVDIRQSVAEAVQAENTTALKQQQQEDHVLVEAVPDGCSEDAVASIKVRAASLQRTYLIRVAFESPVSDLFRHLRTRCGLQMQDFCLVNAYPRSRLDEGDRTSVLERGLTPNASLLLVPLQKQQK